MARRRVRDPRELLSEASRHWYWIPIAVLALGLVSLGMLLGTNWISERLLVRDIALLSAVAEIQTDVAISHLWLEEHVSGDAVPVDEINERIVESQERVKSILGYADPPERVAIQKLEDPELRQRAKSLQALIHYFDDTSRQRQNGLMTGEDVGIGSTLDRQYDQLFSELLREAQFLEDELSQRVEVNQARSRLLLRAIILAWIVIVSLAVVGMWTRERRRQLAEAALSESEAQLLQAQKMEAVGRLAGGVAHDVNNYVAAITAQCELVQRKATPGDRVSQKMASIIETAYKISSLTRRLLAFSRQLALQPEVVDLNEVVEGLERMVRRLIGEDIRLQTRLAPDLWYVKMDPSQLEQIIVNLLVNARDAMPTGGEAVIETYNLPLEDEDLTGMPDLDPGEYVVLRVSDTGHGIDPEHVDKIFDPFFTTKGQSGHSGIGLSTVYGIVRQSGGIITVESTPDEGATFRIYLARCYETPQIEPEVDEEEVDGGTETILLVEDNDDLRVASRSVLEAMGYDVWIAADGAEALERFHSNGGGVDLIISDVVMPGMSGRDLLDRIQETHPDVRFLFVSGYTDNVILRHGIQEGEVHFLEKPYSSERLAAKIREILRTEG